MDLKLKIFLFSLVPLTQGQCPASNGQISWSGPCTHQSILSNTGCDVNDIVQFVEELQEACDAAAL